MLVSRDHLLFPEANKAAERIAAMISAVPAHARWRCRLAATALSVVTSVVKGAVNLAESPMSVDQLLPKGSHVDLLGMPGQRIELTHAHLSST